MHTLNAEQAARLLQLKVKRVQILARQGKLPAFRVGRKWLFRGDEIERMLGASANDGAPRPLELSARNRLMGTVTRLTFDGLMAEVQLRIGDQDLIAVITRSSAERLGLKVGGTAFAVIKSTEIIIGAEGEMS
jgi:molybdate transport system regulatory protein